MRSNPTAAMTVDTTVPWQFTEAGTYAQWLWLTRDFAATVVRSEDAWSWEVKSTGAVPIGSGRGQDFDTSAELVLEAVGKGFPASAGYTRWTKAAARRYALASGVRVDLSDGEGKMVRVTLIGGLTVDGVLYLGDWLLHVVQDGTQRDVHPASVTKVERVA